MRVLDVDFMSLFLHFVNIFLSVAAINTRASVTKPPCTYHVLYRKGMKPASEINFLWRISDCAYLVRVIFTSSARDQRQLAAQSASKHGLARTRSKADAIKLETPRIPALAHELRLQGIFVNGATVFLQPDNQSEGSSINYRFMLDT